MKDEFHALLPNSVPPSFKSDAKWNDHNSYSGNLWDGMGLDGPLFFCGGLDPLLSVVQCGPTLFSSVKVPHLSSAAFPLNHAVRESAPPCL